MRVAIYFAPPVDHPLSVAAAAWLGRDAWTGARLERGRVEGFDPATLESLTAEPRRYGFHATMKPPFRLADNQRLRRQAGALREAAEHDPLRRNAGGDDALDQARMIGEAPRQPGLVCIERCHEAVRVPRIPRRAGQEVGDIGQVEGSSEARHVLRRAAAAMGEDGDRAGLGWLGSDRKQAVVRHGLADKRLE